MRRSLSGFLLIVAVFFGTQPTESHPHHGGAALTGQIIRYMMVGERLRFDGSATTASSGTVDQITQIAIVTPQWACRNPRFVYFNGYGQETSTNPEVVIGNTLPITGAAVKGPGPIFKPVTFSGLSTVTLATSGSGVYAISDPVGIVIPANTSAGSYYILTDINVGSAGNAMPGYVSTNMTGEAGSTSASSQTANLSGGTVSGHISNAFAPIAMLCAGWDGSPVTYLAGDSICEGKGDNLDSSRGTMGYLSRGLDDIGSGRWAYNNWCVAAQNASSGSEGAITNGHYGYRIAIINAAAALNAGASLPFTTLIVEHGANNASGVATTNPAFWSMMHGQFASVPVLQTTLTPHTDDQMANVSSCTSLGLCWTTVLSQIPDQSAYNYPSGAVNVFNGALNGGTTYSCASIGGTSCEDGVVNLVPNVWALSAGAWLVPSFTTTLAADAAVGTSFSMTTCPTVGDELVFDAGTASAEAGVPSGGGFIVTSASGSPCVVVIDSSTVNTHPNGSAIAEALSNDGLHPGQLGAVLASAGVIAAKNAGIIK